MEKRSLDPVEIIDAVEFLDGLHEALKKLVGLIANQRERVIEKFIDNFPKKEGRKGGRYEDDWTRSPISILIYIYLRQQAENVREAINFIRNELGLPQIHEDRSPQKSLTIPYKRRGFNYPLRKDDDLFTEFCRVALEGEMENNEKLFSRIVSYELPGTRPQKIGLVGASVFLFYLNHRKYPVYNGHIQKFMSKVFSLRNPSSAEDYWKFLNLLRDERNQNKILSLYEEIEIEDKSLIRTGGGLNVLMYSYDLNRDNTDQARPLSDLKSKSPERADLKTYLHSSGLLFPDYLSPAFWNALRTKGFVFLAGLTGTGKTKLAVKIAELCGKTHKFISVRPDWTDKTELLGWVNPLAKEGEPRYRKGLVLDFILRAFEDYGNNKEIAQPYFLILDEMNLAHIEYYFADFLSVLESGRDKEGWTNEAIKLHEDNKIEQDDKIPREIKLPPNLYIIGTLNTDETTKSLSPKVLDRGFVLEFGDVDMEGYPPEPSGTAAEAKRAKLLEEIIKPLNDKSLFLSHVGNKGLLNKNVEDFRGPKDNPTDLWERLATLNSLLKPHDLHFGYRVIDEIALFVIAAKSSKVANLDEREAFDLAVCSKVLPKFYGTRARLEKPLQEVIKWAGVPFKPEPGKELEEIEELISACEKQIKGQQENQAQNPKNSADASAPEGTEGAGGSPSADSGGEAQGIQTQFTYPHTALKALRMLRRLYEEGFASYL